MVRDGERGSLLCITAKEPAMEHKGAKRLPATEVKAHLGRIVHDVATTGTPVVIHTRGEDQAVIISLRDFHTLWPTAAAMSAPVRHRVRAALRAADLLSEPTAQELAAVHAFEATHAPADQQRLLASWRQLQLSPALSEIILQRDAFWGRFTRDLLRRYEFLPTRRTIVTRAAALCLKHPLRGFDAIHLASGQ
jgi:prevent-host-death family protein